MSRLQDYFEQRDRELQATFDRIDQNCADALDIPVEDLENLDWETDPLQAKLQAAFDQAVMEQARKGK